MTTPLDQARFIADEMENLADQLKPEMTGFRISYGGAQAHFGVTPDLTTMGKVIGGGLPVGAYGGRREIMEMVSPAGPMYQAGTLSGNRILNFR